MTAMRRVAAAGERDEAAQDDAVADLVLRAADDDDGSFGHEVAGSLHEFWEGYPGGGPSRARMPARWPTRKLHTRRNSTRSPGRRGGAGAGVVDLSRRSGHPDPAARRRLPAGDAARGVAPPRPPPGPRDHPAERDVLAAGGRHDRPRRGGRGRRPGVLGRASGSGSTAATRTTRPARSCRTSTRRGCCRCSRRGRSCRGTSPGSCGAAATILLLLWTVHWAYQPRPLTTAVIVALLAFPVGANLDTGNINLHAHADAVGGPVHRSAPGAACCGPSRPG